MALGAKKNKNTESGSNVNVKNEGATEMDKGQPAANRVEDANISPSHDAPCILLPLDVVEAT